MIQSCMAGRRCRLLQRMAAWTESRKHMVDGGLRLVVAALVAVHTFIDAADLDLQYC